MKGWLSALNDDSEPGDEFNYDLVESDHEDEKEKVLPNSNIVSMTVIPDEKPGSLSNI